MPTPSIPIDVIEQAARRCDDYLLCYGLIAKWELHALGLRLIAEYGSDKVEKTLSWSDLSKSKYPGEDIHNAEKQALAGLSN